MSASFIRFRPIADYLNSGRPGVRLMRGTFGVLGATVIAPLVATIYFGVQQSNAAVLAYILALLWIVLLGLPTFFFFRRQGRVRWWSATVAGFFLGTMPDAVFSWPYHPGVDSGYSAWDGKKMVDYVVHGRATHAGWDQYLHGLCFMGLLGAASAATFWLVWRLIVGSDEPLEERK